MTTTNLAYPFATRLASGEFRYHRTLGEAISHSRRLRNWETKNRVWVWETNAWNVKRFG